MCCLQVTAFWGPEPWPRGEEGACCQEGCGREMGGLCAPPCGTGPSFHLPEVKRQGGTLVKGTGSLSTAQTPRPALTLPTPVTLGTQLCARFSHL